MAYYFLIFLIYSVIGWIWETIFCSFKSKHFAYRGFLLGPYCPVYGMGVLLVLLLVPRHAGTLLNLYFNAVVIVTVTEYLSSWLLEHLFQMQLWDYSQYPLNLNGRVEAIISLFFGLGCLVLIKGIQPALDPIIAGFIQTTHGWGPWLLFVLFLADAVSTISFSLRTKSEVAAVVDQSNEENAAIKEFRLKHLLKNQESASSREQLLHYLQTIPKKWRHRNLQRIIKNYSGFKIRIHK